MQVVRKNSKPVVFLLVILCLASSCSQNKNGNSQATASLNMYPDTLMQPSITYINNPKKILLDTCPLPTKIIIPEEHSNKKIVSNGKELTLGPPQTIRADFFVSMQNFNTEDGLALSSVSCGYSDKTGNLWFGTYGGGVSKYDGKSFTNYTVANGLSNNAVSFISEDKKGNIWIGLINGYVSKYDGKSFQNIHISEEPGNNEILGISESRNGTIWFCTNGSGIYKYDVSSPLIKGINPVNYKTDQGLSSNKISAITEDKLGNIWFGTKNGNLIKYDIRQNKFVNYIITQNINTVVKSICEDKKGNIWFCTDGMGVGKLNPLLAIGPGINPIRFDVKDGLVNNHVWVVLEDRKGNIWFGTQGGGLSKYDGNKFTNITSAQGLVNDIVRSITEDKNGNLWIGTQGGGICKYDGSSFVSYTAKQGLLNNNVGCIAEDKDKNLWFGMSRGGLTKYDGDYFTHFTSHQGLPNKAVLSVLEDTKGNIWMGTYGEGIVKYDGNRVDAITKSQKADDGDDLEKVNGKWVKTFTQYTSRQGLADNTVMCIFEDSDTNIWFGTYGGGVSKFDGKYFTNYTRKEGLVGDNVYKIIEDKNGNIWFATTNGASMYNGNSFTNYTTYQGIGNNTIFSILEDKKGNIWLGTDGDGVSVYNPSLPIAKQSNPITYNTANGIVDNTVTSIVEDTLTNTIWLGTNVGISSLNLEGGNFEKVRIENFNVKTGFPVKDVNTNTFLIDEHAVIWAGTGDRLIRFDHAEINKSYNPPAIFIQNIKINNEAICWNDLENANTTAANITEEVTTFGRVLSEAERDSLYQKFSHIQFDSITPFYSIPLNLELPYQNNNITFEFAAIETSRPYLMKYQYILEGYNDDWTPATNISSATFGNIREGSYTFKLKAQSPDGIWSEPIEYSFTVNPPWYRTWWAYTLYVTILLCGLVAILSFNGKRLRKRAKLLMEEVHKATKEIVHQKELVEIQKKVLEEKNKSINDSIRYASKIQTAILPPNKEMEEGLNNHFVLYKPKDIVSGDFYWIEQKDDVIYFAVVDCTGHGVPGALMSIIGFNSLNKIVRDNLIYSPANILDKLNEEVESILRQKDLPELKDGMDIAFCMYDTKTMELEYAGANNPLYIVRSIDNEAVKDPALPEPFNKDNHLNFKSNDIKRGDTSAEVITIATNTNKKTSLYEIKADRQPIGLFADRKQFTNNKLQLLKGDSIYIFSDGYADQFGGPKNKKFQYRQLKELLLKINNRSMPEQKILLESNYYNWKGDQEQIDDVCILGVKI